MVESVYAKLEPLLPVVRKPVQYVGGELNSVVKDWDSADVRWALMYPDAYEVGVPNQGIQILYEVLNEQPGVLAERTYSVWPDLEAAMRQNGVPQFTVARELLDGGISFTDLCTEHAAIFPSKGETRKLIQGGGVSLNKEKVADPAQKVAAADLIAGKYLLVQKGKKNYYLIIAQ
jgi:hypothetical protein